MASSIRWWYLLYVICKVSKYTSVPDIQWALNACPSLSLPQKEDRWKVESQFMWQGLSLIFLTKVEMGKLPAYPRVIVCTAKLWPVHQACWHSSGFRHHHQADHEVPTYHNLKMAQIYTIFPKKTSPIITETVDSDSTSQPTSLKTFCFPNMGWKQLECFCFILEGLLRPIPLFESSSLVFQSSVSLRSPIVFLFFPFNTM